MNLRTYLPYDVARCNGREVDGYPAVPCDDCARREFRHQVCERQVWIDRRPVMGYCPDLISMEMEE